LVSKEKNSKNLPKYFSWENFIPEVVDQGKCGSCYAITTAHMITSRLRIKVF
jgi:C1A family cysteine protease